MNAWDDQEVVVNPTWWERVINKLFPAPWAAEERAALIEITKRVQWKNEQYLKRQERRASKLDEDSLKRSEQKKILQRYNLVTTWSYGMSIKETQHGPWVDVNVKVGLRENAEKMRIVELISVNKAKDGTVVSSQDRRNACMKYLKTTAEWLQFVQPWWEWTLSTEDLKAKGGDNFIWVGGNPAPKKKKRVINKA